MVDLIFAAVTESIVLSFAVVGFILSVYLFCAYSFPKEVLDKRVSGLTTVVKQFATRNQKLSKTEHKQSLKQDGASSARPNQHEQDNKTENGDTNANKDEYEPEEQDTSDSQPNPVDKMKEAELLKGIKPMKKDGNKLSLTSTLEVDGEVRSFWMQICFLLQWVAWVCVMAVCIILFAEENNFNPGRILVTLMTTFEGIFLFIQSLFLITVFSTMRASIRNKVRWTISSTPTRVTEASLYATSVLFICAAVFDYVQWCPLSDTTDCMAIAMGAVYGWIALVILVTFLNCNFVGRMCAQGLCDVATTCLLACTAGIVYVVAWIEVALYMESNFTISRLYMAIIFLLPLVAATRRLACGSNREQSSHAYAEVSDAQHSIDGNGNVNDNYSIDLDLSNPNDALDGFEDGAQPVSTVDRRADLMEAAIRDHERAQNRDTASTVPVTKQNSERHVRFTHTHHRISNTQQEDPTYASEPNNSLRKRAQGPDLSERVQQQTEKWNALLQTQQDEKTTTIVSPRKTNVPPTLPPPPSVSVSPQHDVSRALSHATFPTNLNPPSGSHKPTNMTASTTTTSSSLLDGDLNEEDERLLDSIEFASDEQNSGDEMNGELPGDVMAQLAVLREHHDSKEATGTSTRRKPNSRPNTKPMHVPVSNTKPKKPSHASTLTDQGDALSQLIQNNTSETPRSPTTEAPSEEDDTNANASGGSEDSKKKPGSSAAVLMLAT